MTEVAARHGVGGRGLPGAAALTYAGASKLFPGVLVLYLLARRQWRAAVATAAASLVLTVWALVDLGRPPFLGFVDHLPGLLGGEAFPALRNPAATAINFSIPGLAFKLKLFGVPGMGFPVAKALGWAYTLVLLAATWRVARRPPSEADGPVVWLALLVLATLRRPFLPQG